ncbi:unnamed protein product [Lactuca saligna]|uniref:Uncharacterized protein n=1 Tax=Lactuca saligna TaxID=75948 RepID=A0AA35Y4J0_LACSI|nr:unnamed protein product [Lactuca saligna]
MDLEHICVVFLDIEYGWNYPNLELEELTDQSINGGSIGYCSGCRVFEGVRKGSSRSSCPHLQQKMCSNYASISGLVMLKQRQEAQTDQSGSNIGLKIAIDLCEEVKAKHPRVTYADLNQNCMENEFNIDHTREMFEIEFNHKYICEDQVDYMDR